MGKNGLAEMRARSQLPDLARVGTAGCEKCTDAIGAFGQEGQSQIGSLARFGGTHARSCHGL
jgi:hypothetical protein